MTTRFGGYMGRMLKIDLTTREVSEYPISDEQARSTWAAR